ncbi:hypothetical protein [Bauldia litoralis]|uniref:Uncharacterized protein n=1 Tax=Bauldia litoralis TaxID=665467 RepID=A0A1G6BML4_9HYPH|nr:hypothetical protein [Bauldia litoralis]SDB21824.1 hypothetical protein SAMN02982931_01630 [Bauldia litoralis]
MTANHPKPADRGLHASWLALGLIAALAASLVTTAQAAEPTSDRVVDFSVADEAPGWEFSVTPYAWLTGISGDIGVAGRTVGVNVTFQNIISESDYIIPLMGYVEARNDRFAIFGDFFYTQVRFTGSKSVTRNPFADASLTLKGKAGLTQTLGFAEGGAAYEVAQWQGPMGATGLELLGGARYWYASVDTTLNIDSTVKLKQLGLKRKNSRAYAKSGDIDWVDPVIGARVRQDFGEGRQLELLGDVAGFGVGSEFSWQVFAGYTKAWEVGRATMAWTLGYRAIGVDYTEGKGTDAKTFDLVLHGPIAGFTVGW